MEIVKILRLVTGEDVIGYIEPVTNGVIIRVPMEIYLKTDPKTGHEILNMNNWLPFNILAKSETTILFKDILCALEPTKEVIEYYGNSVMTLEEKNMSDSSDTETSVKDIKSELMTSFLNNLDIKEFGPVQ